ncbi:MAG: response regulator transcription factor [Candidatus Enteromonas sp.]|nr:response regulator transcription factor [Candidatus Enteromonas sp.]
MRKPLIYFADDEENIRSLLEASLDMAGFACKSFSNAADLIREIGVQEPDLILLDIMMPGMNGFEALQHLKKEPKTKDIPVIMLSAKDGEMDKVNGLNAGACDYISKPFGVLELAARIRANLRKKEVPSVVEYRDLRLDECLHSLFLGETKIDLSSTEYRLLRYFILHPQKALTKDELLTEIWGIGEEIETRNLDVYVSRIRKKISVSEAHIETVRGVGYLLQ